MIFGLVLLLLLLNYSAAQDANCDFYQNMAVGDIRYITSPNYPSNYTAGVTCRWIVDCPSGYNCRADCSEIRIPQSSGCTRDRLVVSRNGDPQLNGAETYCGAGSLSVVSTGQRISMGLITYQPGPGGRFQCQVTPQLASPPPTTCRCGERRQNRIVGGQETGINEYPMMGALVDLRTREIKCGAVIISQVDLLTAAHCVVNQSVYNYAIVVGEHNIADGESNATKPYAISRFIIHPSFSASNYDSDIALIRVTTSIKFSDRVLPVCLPFKNANNDFAGSKVTVLGWGTLYPGGPKSNVLMKVDLDVLQQSTCRTRGAQVTDRQMCTWTRGKDACQDDSGGPLLWTDPITRLLKLVGLISYGRFCASETPGTNTRVTSFLNWILANAPNDYCVK